MNTMTIAHMAGVLTSAIQAADRLELDALKGPALADMDLDRRPRYQTRLLDLHQPARPVRKGATMSDRQFQESKRIALATSGLALHALRTQPARPDCLAGQERPPPAVASSGRHDHA
ncbi:MAG: hypothetical protein V8S69_02960 [Dakarella massiliensis]